MRKHRISHDDASALVKGEASATRPDLVPLADAIADFRIAAFASPLRPSAELTARLELAETSGISQEASPTWRAETIKVRARVTDSPAPVLGKVKKMFAWFTGLGIAMKVALGLAVAAAASVTGVGAVVAYNEIAPTFEQEQVTPTDDPTDEETTDPTDPDTFGTSVSERAHELGKDSDGAAFGEETSEQAQQLGDEHAQNPEGTNPAPGAENAENGKDHAPDLPDVTPGGDDTDD